MIYKRPESVLVVIYSRKGDVLLLRRRDVPDFWQSVTGSLKHGETAAQAAARELWEETGLYAEKSLEDCRRHNLFPIRPPWRQRYAPDVTHNMEYVFRFSVAESCEILLNPAEHLDYRWLSRNRAVQVATSHTNKVAIQEFVP